MSLLERARNSSSDADLPDRDWRSIAVAVGYGLVGAASLVLLMLIPAVIAWVVDPRSSATWTSTLTFVGSAWTMVHAGSVAVPADGVQHVVLAPLVLTGLAVLLARSAAKAMLSSLTHVSSDTTRRGGWDVRGAFVAGYVALGLILVIVTHTGPAPASWWRMLPGAVVVATAGMVWAQWRAEDEQRGPVTVLRDAALDRIPPALPRAVRPALEGVAAFLGLGTIVVLLLVVTHLGRIGTLNGQLDAGITGTIIVSLLQLTLLPNLALYAGAWLTGSTVQLGAVSISSSSVHAGVLPMLPVLGAVPEAGPLPAWVAAAPVLPVLLGVGIGWRASARHTRLSPLTAKLATAASAAALATVALLLLMWLGRAQVTPGAMEHVGASLGVIPLLLVELLGGSCLTAVTLHWVRTRR